MAHILQRLLLLSHIQLVIEYSDTELKAINIWFPNLFYKKGEIRGEIDFKAEYKRSGSKKNTYWEIVPCSSGDGCVQDVYEIEIDLHIYPPTVFETAGRIKRLAEKLSKQVIELHLNSNDGSCCLGIFSEREGEKLSEFVINKVFPYFVWQAYYEKFEKIPPCGEYSHDRQGVREFVRYKANLGRNQLCSCGSGKKYKFCCLPRHAGF